MRLHFLKYFEKMGPHTSEWARILFSQKNVLKRNVPRVRVQVGEKGRIEQVGLYKYVNKKIC